MLLISNLLLVTCLACGEELKLPSRLILHGGNMADMITTINRPINSYETNPLIGKNPSDTLVITTKIAGSVTIDYLLSKLSKEHSKLANTIAIATGIIFGSVAYHNYTCCRQ